MRRHASALPRPMRPRTHTRRLQDGVKEEGGKVKEEQKKAKDADSDEGGWALCNHCAERSAVKHCVHLCLREGRQRLRRTRRAAELVLNLCAEVGAMTSVLLLARAPRSQTRWRRASASCPSASAK